jgi:hypothetical protein
MKRSLIMIISVMTISLYIVFHAFILEASDSEGKSQIITQEQAAELAAKLANEKFQSTFGLSPFKPGFYQAKLAGSRWHWGKINPAGVKGCSAKVEFNKDGSEPDVKVAYHTDEVLPSDQITEPKEGLPEILKK